MRFLKYKKGWAESELGKWLIAIAVLVILIGGAVYLKVKGISVLEYVKDLFRFSRR